MLKAISVPEPGADVQIFARDCCHRDDVVEVYVNGCLLATISSIGGEFGTHAGETHAISLTGGTHTIEYRIATSGIRAESGWEVYELLSPYTGRHVCGDCVDPEGDHPRVSSIVDFPECGNAVAGRLSPQWGDSRWGQDSFGQKEILEADSGERLHLECLNGSSYALFYGKPGEQALRVGTCPFLNGCNNGWFFHTGDQNNNGKPDCFVSTFWRSRDYGENDPPKRWTGGEQEDPELLDWADSIYNANSDRLAKFNHKYEYQVRPPIPSTACFIDRTPSFPGMLAEGPWVKSIPVKDPPLGPETEEFFDQVAEDLQSLDVPVGPMHEGSRALCDIDWNGACDRVDQGIFREAVGKCRGEPGYHLNADINGDGCVGTFDEAILWPDDSE